MRKMKLILPILAVLAIVVFAFGNRAFPKKNTEIEKTYSNEKFADTYFVFNGTSTTQYTDSTKWTRHETNPSVSCDGGSLACKIKSATISTKSSLVTYIGSNGINGSSITVMEQKP